MKKMYIIGDTLAHVSWTRSKAKPNRVRALPTGGWRTQGISFVGGWRGVGVAPVMVGGLGPIAFFEVHTIAFFAPLRSLR